MSAEIATNRKAGRDFHILDKYEAGLELKGTEVKSIRAGKINEDMLIDPGSARRNYLEALEIDPAYLPAIRALKGIYEVEQDWESYEKALLAPPLT